MGAEAMESWIIFLVPEWLWTSDWSAITQYFFNHDILTYCSSLFALLSVAIIFNETLKVKQQFKFHLLKMTKQEVINRQAPAFWVTLSYINYG
jgi:hypothetical protein